MAERPLVLVTLNPATTVDKAIRVSPSIRKLRQTGNDVVVTTIHDSPRERERKYAQTHGLLLPGGVDIHPSAYGQDPHPQLGITNPAFDAMQIGLVKKALDDGRPTLGLCRGAQILSVATDGFLHQHIPDITNEYHGPSIEIAGESSKHDIHLVQGTKVHELVGTELLRDVPSRHHQAIDNPGAMVVAGRSPAGIIEFIEHPDLPFVVGEQPHGELITPDNHNFTRLHTIFTAFHDEVVEEKRRSRRAS